MADGDAPKKKVYEAMCHCTAIKYTVKIPSLEAPTFHPVVYCNCSICQKAGYLLVYPQREEVVFTQGKELLRTYNPYATKACHYFCPTCGSSLYIDPAGQHPRGDVLCMSVRMFRGVDLDKLSLERCDGKGFLHPELNEKFW